MMSVAVLVAFCLLCAGCRGTRMVELRSDPSNPLAERLKLTARGGPKPSERTMLLLRRYDLTAGLNLGPRKVLPALAELYEQEPTTEGCYALAELSYLAGRKMELRDQSRALAMYWSSVMQAYTYLFDPRFDQDRNPYDPQFRGACDLYNSALESCLRLSRKEGYFKPGQTVSFLVGNRRVDVSIESKGFEWSPDEFDRFEFVSDYQVNGLKNQYRTFGLGVPLIAVRKQGVDRPEIERHYAHALSFPVTAFLRLDVGRDGSVIDQSHLHLELHDPLEATDINVAGYPVPLESDISTPLAYFLDHPSFDGLDTMGLLRVDRTEKISGIYMVQPYQPGKIPVLMIHGIWSSPMTWMEAFNDLQSMPDIREKYQFWFYLYPTGKPFWETAAQLRRDLADLRKQFEPLESEPVLDQMVLVGHSMGGLIAKMQAVDSGDRYWKTVSDKPFRVIKGDDELRKHFEEIYFFQPNHSVRRIVTIGSPHRGSEFSNRATRWLTRSITFLPQHTYDAASKILLKNPRIIKNPDPLFYMTGVDSLTPKSPILNVLYESPTTETIKHHNVVGITKETALEKNGDGIVAYSSAHLENVASEIVVKAHHTEVHRHPRTVIEIRRILKEHLSEFEKTRNQTILPVSRSGDVGRFGHDSGFGHSVDSEAPQHLNSEQPVGKISLPAIEAYLKTSQETSSPRAMPNQPMSLYP